MRSQNPGVSCRVGIEATGGGLDRLIESRRGKFGVLGGAAMNIKNRLESATTLSFFWREHQSMTRVALTNSEEEGVGVESGAPRARSRRDKYQIEGN